MVQADFLWTFAIGSSFAAAAANQLQNEDKPFANKYFATTLLVLGVFVVPAVISLTIIFPGWETMFVLYPWLVDMGNPTPYLVPVSAGLVVAGIIICFNLCATLGFFLAFRFIKAGNRKAAHALWIAGYAGTFLMMFVGWDGSGWERMTFAGSWWEWHQWKVLGGSNPYVWQDFFSTNVFRACMLLAVYVLPPIGYVYLKWPRQGRAI